MREEWQFKLGWKGVVMDKGFRAYRVRASSFVLTQAALRNGNMQFDVLNRPLELHEIKKATYVLMQTEVNSRQ